MPRIFALIFPGLLGIDPGAHVGGGKGRRLFAGEADEGPGPGRREVFGQAGHLQQHGHAAGVVVGAGGAGHRVEMRPQDIVAAGRGLPGDNVAHFLAQVGVALAAGLIAQPLEVLEDIIFGGLEVFGAIDGALPEP